MDGMVVACRIFISGIATYALLDPGATHSFIYENFIKRPRILPEVMELGCRVTVPPGEQMLSNRIVKDVELRFQKNVSRADLIVLPMPEFDIILGMDCLTSNEVTIEAVKNRQMPHLISCIGGWKMLRRVMDILSISCQCLR